jgi:hypothetical protein
MIQPTSCVQTTALIRATTAFSLVAASRGGGVGVLPPLNPRSRFVTEPPEGKAFDPVWGGLLLGTGPPPAGAVEEAMGWGVGPFPRLRTRAYL